jgi:RNA polymerase sigma factor (TIGR02999 family)
MDQGEITRLLQQMARGDRAAEAELMPLVYAELRRLARSVISGERPHHTLQTTALVHEAYLRLIGGGEVDLTSRGHFFAIAASTMRRILIDHARARRSAKRGGSVAKVDIEHVVLGTEESWDQILAVHSALDRLAAIDDRAAKVVELRFFAGLETEEAARVLGVSDRTVKRDWQFAQAWLYSELR